MKSAKLAQVFKTAEGYAAAVTDERGVLIAKFYGPTELAARRNANIFIEVISALGAAMIEAAGRPSEMLFGDAKKSLYDIISAALRDRP